MHMLLLLLTIHIQYCLSIRIHHVFYWSVWPYIREKNETMYTAEGILPEVIERSFLYCHLDGIYEFRYHKAFDNHNDYLNFVKSNFTRGQGLLQEVSTNTSEDYLWFGPMISPEISPVIHPWINNALRTVEAPGAHVIVDRSLVSWKYKLLEGVNKSLNYLVLSILMSVCIGTFVFLIESRQENEFGRTFPEGVWNGFWWSTVTMTTIGYGDIVPKSILGRSLGLFWLIFGILIGSVITATVTDSMFSSDHLKIYHKKVAVLAHSWEENIAEGFEADIKAMDSYEEVIQAVRDGDAFAALINSDVVRWRQKDITTGETPLAIAYQVKLEIPIQMNGDIEGVVSLWECLQRHKKDIFDTPKRKYFLQISRSTVYYVSLKELLIDDWFGLILLLITIITIVLSMICLFIEKYVVKKKIHFRDSIRVLLHQKDTENSDNVIEMKNTIPRISITPETPIHSSWQPGHYNAVRRHSRVPNDNSSYTNVTFPYDSTDNKSVEQRVENIESDISQIKKMLQKLVQKESPILERKRRMFFNSKDLSPKESPILEQKRKRSNSLFNNSIKDYYPKESPILERKRKISNSIFKSKDLSGSLM